jgi:hypothetical protein
MSAKAADVLDIGRYWILDHPFRGPGSNGDRRIYGILTK